MKRENWITLSFILIGLVMFVLACQKEREAVSPDEILSGGENFTIYDFGQNAFGAQGTALTREESRGFVVGNSLFRRNWVEAPASVTSLDGLGPLFNERSCGGCHFKDGRAAPFDEFPVRKPGLLFHLSLAGALVDGSPIPHPIYGGQLQDKSIPDVPAEAQIEINYETISGSYADGTPYTLQKPIYNFTNQAYGGNLDGVLFSPRIAPHIAGMGLLEAIPEQDILARQDIDDKDGDGISGKANYVWDVASQSLKLGRFSWKSNAPSIMQQNAAAFNGDMGLTTHLFPKSDFTDAQEALYPNLPNGGEPEVSDSALGRVTLYVQTLAVPAKRNTDDPKYLAGRKIFEKLACASCHVPTHTTGAGNVVPSLDNQKIHPFTDLLLHDMGEDLSDNRPVFLANGNEWRTPPLWGIGLIPTVNKHTRLLHDGRARSIEEAILWHGGEAEKSKEQFINLSKKEREELIFFLENI